MADPLVALLFPTETAPKIADLHIHQLSWVHLFNASDAVKNRSDGLMGEII